MSDEIIATVRERVLRFATSRKRNDADDLAQEVVLKMMQSEKYNTFADKEEATRVAIGFAVRVGLGQVRKSVRHGEPTASRAEDMLDLTDSGPNPERQLARKMVSSKIAEALERVGSPCKELLGFWMRKVKGSEIQKRLGLASVGAVHTRTNRCLAQLRESLNPGMLEAFQ
jgi:RNA polymerase sigma factor (sigma-70 family)